MSNTFSPIAMADNFGKRLVEIFGLNGQHVVSITLECRADRPVRINIERLCTQEEAENLATYLEGYYLAGKSTIDEGAA